MAADPQTDLAGADSGDVRAKAASAALALWAQSGSHAAATELVSAGIPVMILKGPDLQARLFGTPAAYPSGDVDVLIPRRFARRARAVLAGVGWTFEPEQGVLWRASAAASFVRDGLRLDLHWGLHVAHLPAASLRPLERALWRDASVGPSGYLEPDAAALTVFLALHAAGHRRRPRPEWRDAAIAAFAIVDDRRRLVRIARDARVARTVRAVLGGSEPPACLLDGVSGWGMWWGSWIVRGHAIPAGWRDRTRRWLEPLTSRSSVGRPGDRVTFCGLSIEVWDGVFRPRPPTDEIVALALAALEDRERPTVLDVGTGSGAVALAIAARRPDARILACDVDPVAVRCASVNATRLGLADRVSVVWADVRDGLPAADEADVITTNLPYVAPVAAAGDRWDAPLRSVQGDDHDGLGLLREVSSRAASCLVPGGALVLQVTDWQWDGWADELRAAGYEPIAPRTRRPGRAVVGMARWRGAP
jgi:release factor glutamine methyltransferase